MNTPATNQNRVLIYRTGHLGDTICAIPAFRLVRQFFPDAHLTLLCDQPQGAKVAAFDVVRQLSIFDEILTYTSRGKVRTLVELVHLVRIAKPDIAIVLPQVSEPRDSVRRKVEFFRRCGVPDVRGHNFPALRHSWQPTEADRLVHILRSVGVRGSKPTYGIPVHPASRESVIAVLQELGINATKPFLLFCGGGKDPAQHWPLDRYARVLPTLGAEMGWPIVALGNAQETKTYQSGLLPQFAGLRLLPRPLDLLELFEICRLATAFFGNDCGPMHAAASVGCPVAVLMSARALPGAWHPNVTPSLVIRLRVDCEGCLLRECIEEKHRCMTGLTEDQVLAEVPTFLKGLPGRSS